MADFSADKVQPCSQSEFPKVEDSPHDSRQDLRIHNLAAFILVCTVLGRSVWQAGTDIC